MFANTSFNKGALPVLRKAIQFSQQRNVLIANNIANVETPNYEAQDLAVDDFQKMLTKAIDERRAGNPRKWEFGSSRNMRERENGPTYFRTVPAEQIDNMDHGRNNVDIDKEMVKLAKNTMMHNGMIELLSKQYSLIESAISERV